MVNNYYDYHSRQTNQQNFLSKLFGSLQAQMASPTTSHTHQSTLGIGSSFKQRHKKQKRDSTLFEQNWLKPGKTNNEEDRNFYDQLQQHNNNSKSHNLPVNYQFKGKNTFEQAPNDSNISVASSSAYQTDQEDDEDQQNDGFEDTFSSSREQFNQVHSSNNNWRWKKRKKISFKLSIVLLIILFVGFILLLGKLFFIIYTQKDDISNVQAKSNQTIIEWEKEINKNWLVSSPKCHVPNLNFWDKSIKGFVSYKKALNCSEHLNIPPYGSETPIGKSMSYVQDNKLYFTEEAILKGYLEDGNCCYREIRRADNNDKDLIHDETCLKIAENGMIIPFEIIHLECFMNEIDNTTAKTTTTTTTTPAHTTASSTETETDPALKIFGSRKYSNVHAFIVPKPEEVEVLSKAMKKNLDRDQYYNVILIGMDTISRLNAHRQLNETMKVLKDDFQAIEFYGYNKVGENTFPNLIPFLTGLTPAQLVETKCWLATNYTDEGESADEYLNDCKYLWNFFQEFGYMTYFSEDWPQASTFNYLKPGFKQEPTAYYGRPISLARRDYIVDKPNLMDCDLCVRDKPIVSLDLDFLKNYLNFYQNNPHFAFQWMNCPPHNDLNGASSVDEILANFFRDIHKITYLERSFVIFFSDHGWRWNDFIGTRIGHYEASLPLMTISPPKKFIEQHPDLYEHLKSHKQTLFTPFDMFKTVIDIRNLAKKSKSNMSLSLPFFYPDIDAFMASLSSMKSAIETPSTNTSESNISSFKQIPLLTGTNYKQKFHTISLLEPMKGSRANNRSCIEAGIPDNYCICHEFQQEPVNCGDVIAAAYYLVYVHLDSRVLEGEKICTRLNLMKIESAERYDYDTDLKANGQKVRRRRAAVPNETLKLTTTPVPTIPTTSTLDPDEEFNDSSPTSQVINETSSSPLEMNTSSTNLNEGSTKESFVDEMNFLPNKEYKLQVITQPGEGSFQEVIRFYGENITDCIAAGREIKTVIMSKEVSVSAKREAVIKMNERCNFSIHSDSISRLNLYKDQSKCVKSNSELHKVCYCKDLFKEEQKEKATTHK